MGRSRKIAMRRLVYDRLEARRLLSLVLSPTNITATTQSPYDGVVATLIDTVRSDSPSSFTTPPGSVQIDWGDGSTTAGTVVGPIYPGVFEVEGSHAYTAADSYSTQITVANQSGYDAIANGTANVTSQPPQLLVAGQDIAGTAGTALTNVPVATFLDTNTSDTSGQFLALITWGDGNASLGTVTGGNGAFTVSGTNTYADPGDYTTNVTILDTANSVSAVATAHAVITAAPTLTATGTTFSATPGTAMPANTVIANFTDSNPNANAGNITAVINWGDGQTTAGTVNATTTPGDFTVTGSHAYPVTGTAGSYPVTVTIADPSGQTVLASGTALITTDINATGTAFSATPKTALPTSTIVANFTDSNPLYVNNPSPSTLPTAVIDWGDGQTSSGTVNLISSNASGGTFTVTGSHTYASPAPLGSYPVTVTILDPSGQTATTVGSAFVTTPAAGTVFTASGTTFTTTPGTPLPSGTIVANIVDTNPNANAGNIAATIDWGDGQTTVGTVTATAKPNVYTVTAPHTYSAVNPPASFTITVTVTDPSGQKVTATSDALVASFINATGTTFNAMPGTALPSNTVVANFTDTNPNANVGNIIAVINWGDGQTTAGTVGQAGSPTSYSVTGSHAYASSSASSYTVTVTILDPSGQTATASSTAILSPIATLTPFPTTAYFTAGVTPSSPVFLGSFFDTNTGTSAGQFTASINWGDGNVTAGTVAATSPSGLFLVTGTHAYATQGSYTIAITIQDQLGNAVTISSKAVVTPAAGTLTASPPITNYYTAGVAPSGPVTVGSFTDSNTAASPGLFTASINWGDGTVSPGTVTQSSSAGLFLVTGTHTYTTPGNYQGVTITIQDQAGDRVTITGAAVVSPATGTLTASPPMTSYFTAGVAPSGPVTVGSFTDSNPGTTAGQFTASIDWGDGNTSAGTVTAAPGNTGLFLVSGTHTYAVPGTSYGITITVQDQAGDRITIAGTAVVSPASTTITPNPPITNTFTAGAEPASPVTVGSFYDSNPSATASQFTATIDWGDGNTSAGTVTAAPGSTGLFLVSGNHLYAGGSPSYAVTITVYDQTGHTATWTGTSVVTNYNAGGTTASGAPIFSGGLANIVTNGPYAARGFTNTNRPTFSGTAAPFAIVQVFARHFNVDAQLPIGEAVADSSGHWTLTSGPLAVGTYLFTATVTVPGGYPSDALTLTNAVYNKKENDLVYIDLTPSLVRWLSHGGKTSVVHVRRGPPHPKASKLTDRHRG